ncbi:MAG: indolepyruvate oxidoreductase subunit beta [Candidatus Hodarchaeales archaeon]|jgi:indolepyruvate ferredoxin oxidoreductase beta subunit
MEYQIFLAGVGGQGILSVTDILCNAAIEMGFTVRGSETHGMSQRGGSVFSNVRFGNVHSPLIMERTADILMGFEPAETLRYAQFVKPNGYSLVNKHPIPSPSFILSKDTYPKINTILNELHNYSEHIFALNATELATNLGKPIIQNIIMLGSLSAVPDLPLTNSAILLALKRQFRDHFYDLNLQAYQLGRTRFEEYLA